MDGIQAILSEALKQHVIVPEDAPKPSVEITKAQDSYFGEPADIPLKDIVSNLKTNVKFKLTTIMNVAFSVGNGFYISSDQTKPTGRKAKELIDDFNEEWDIDTLNQLIARDVWAAGNTFLNAVPQDDNPMAALYHLPMSAFTKINRDLYGEVTEYVMNWGQHVINRKVKPSDGIIQWAWLPLDESAFGEGLGQIMARKGLGYQTEGGTTVKKDSLFQTQEMIDDVTGKMLYAGLPRYFSTFTGEGATADYITAVRNQFNKLDPLQHFVGNVEGKVETVSLDTQNRFDSFLKHQDDQTVHASMTPLLRLWSSLNFTYASSQEAVEAMMPLIGMYQRAHKRFIERMVYHPLLRFNNYDIKKANIRLNWGKQDPLTIEEIRAVFDLMRDPSMLEKFNPDDILNMLIDSGVPLTRQAQKSTQTELNDLRHIIGRSQSSNSTVRMRLQKPHKSDPNKDLKTKLLKKIIDSYGK